MSFKIVITAEVIERMKRIAQEDPYYLFNKFFDQHKPEIKSIIDLIKDISPDNLYLYDSINLDNYFITVLELHKLNLFYAKEIFNIEIQKNNSHTNVSSSGCAAADDDDDMRNEKINEIFDDSIINDYEKFDSNKNIFERWKKILTEIDDFHKQLKTLTETFNLNKKINQIIIWEKLSIHFNLLPPDIFKPLFHRDEDEKTEAEIAQEKSKIAERLLRIYAFAYRATPIINPNSSVFPTLNPILRKHSEYTSSNHAKYHEIFEAFRQGDAQKVIKMYEEYKEIYISISNDISNTSAEPLHIKYTLNFFEKEINDILNLLKFTNKGNIEKHNNDILTEINNHEIYHSENIIGKFIQKQTGYTDRINKVKTNVEDSIQCYMNSPIDEVYESFMPLNNVQEQCLEFLKKFNISTFINNSTFKTTEKIFLSNIQKLNNSYQSLASKIGIKREYLGKDTNIVFTPYIFYSGMYNLDKNLVSFNPIYFPLYSNLEYITSTILHEWIHHLDFILNQKYSAFLGNDFQKVFFETYTNQNVIKGVFFNNKYVGEKTKHITPLLAHQHIIENILNSSSSFKQKQEDKKKFILNNLLTLNRDLRKDPSFEFTDKEKENISYERLYNNSLFMNLSFKIDSNTNKVIASTAIFEELIHGKEIYFPGMDYSKCCHLQSAFKLIKFSSYVNEFNKECLKYFIFNHLNISNEEGYTAEITELTSSYNNRKSVFVNLAKIDDYFENKHLINLFVKRAKTKNDKHIKLKKENKFQLNSINTSFYHDGIQLNYYQSPDEIFARYFENGFFPKQNFRDLLNFKFIGLTPIFNNYDKVKEHLDLLIVSIFGEECLAKRNQPQNHPAINFTEDTKIVNCETYSINKDELLSIHSPSIRDFSRSMNPTKDLIERSKNIRQKLEEQSDISPIHTKILNQIKIWFEPKTNKFENKETVHINPISLYESSIQKTKHKDKR